MLSLPVAARFVTLSWAVFYILAVLFGAPFFSDIIATAVLATALTAVSALPAVFLFDSEERAVEVILQLFSCEGNPTPKESVLLFNSVFAFLGAWAAAAVHPLDWDRWWQRYPLPSLVGCFIGAVIGIFIAITRIFVIKRTAYNKTKKR